MSTRAGQTLSFSSRILLRYMIILTTEPNAAQQEPMETPRCLQLTDNYRG